MHPEIARSIAGEHRNELQRRAELQHLARLLRRAAQPRGPGRPGVMSRLAALSRLVTGHRVAARRRSAAQPGREIALPGVFTAGQEAFGFRTYLTAAEARQLAADWTALLSAFADRVDDPSLRPPGAVPFEVVVLGRQVPDLAGAGQGLPGPGPAN
jgi:hypothetical protein